MIREAILKELARREWSIARFSKELENNVSERTLHIYLEYLFDIPSRTAEQILQALNLQISKKES